MAQLWGRPLYTATNAKARLHFVIFSERPESVDVDRARDGSPPGAEGVPFQLALRNDAESLKFFHGLLEHLVGVMGEVDRSRVRRSEVVQLRFELSDPPDMRALQAAVALCHAFARMPATTAVLDMLTGVLWSPEAMAGLAAEREFDVREHVCTISSADTTNTRGLAKLARPDLLLRGVPPGQSEAASLLLWLAAEALCLGKPCRPGRDAFRLQGVTGELPIIMFVPPPPALQTETWGNEYVELRDTDGSNVFPDCSTAIDAVATQFRALRRQKLP